MKKFFTLFLGLFFLTILSGYALANEEMNGQKQMVGSYQIELFTPESLSEGEKEITVKITKDNTPLTNANVKIMAEMDKSDSSMKMDMDNIKPIEKVLDAGTEAGEYMTTIDFNGNGKWKITVIPDENQKATFEVMVQKSGPNWIVIGGFIGLILLVVLIAAFGRRRKNADLGGGTCCGH